MLRKFTLYLSMALPVVILLAISAYAQEDGVASASPSLLPIGSAIGSGLAIGLAVLGGGIGQGIAIFGGLQGIARNPGAGGAIRTWLIVGLALVESLVIYAFVIAFLLYGKI